VSHARLPAVSTSPLLTVLQIGHSKIFKRSWWETMQAQVNQKASNKDIQQLRAQIAQIQSGVQSEGSRPSTRGSVSRARTPVADATRPAAAQAAAEIPTGQAGTGRLVNGAADRTGARPDPHALSWAEPQMHVVVGEFPTKSNPRMSRTLGGGAVALRADDEIVFLQNRLEEKLQVLKKMYDNKGWGVRGATVLSAASMLAEPLDMSRMHAVEAAPGALPTRSLWSRNSHQRAMRRVAGALPPGAGAASVGRRQLYPMDHGSGVLDAPFRSITGQSPLESPISKSRGARRAPAVRSSRGFSCLDVWFRRATGLASDALAGRAPPADPADSLAHAHAAYLSGCAVANELCLFKIVFLFLSKVGKGPKRGSFFFSPGYADGGSLFFWMPAGKSRRPHA